MLLDWDLINSVNLDELNDEKAESLYDQLIEVYLMLYFRLLNKTFEFIKCGLY
jgi:hypothetical protein